MGKYRITSRHPLFQLTFNYCNGPCEINALINMFYWYIEDKYMNIII